MSIHTVCMCVWRGVPDGGSSPQSGAQQHCDGALCLGQWRRDVIIVKHRSYGGKERERERERNRDRERETARERDTHTKRDTDTERARDEEDVAHTVKTFDEWGSSEHLCFNHSTITLYIHTKAITIQPWNTKHTQVLACTAADSRRSAEDWHCVPTWEPTRGSCNWGRTRRYGTT